MYQAQHHAIWRDADGVYQDITPDEDFKVSETIFLVDGRAPFDYKKYRHPVNFYCEDPATSRSMWGVEAINKFQSIIFYGFRKSNAKVLKLLCK